MTIKGVRRREGDMLHWISVLYGTFFEYKTIAKKKCAPKTRATLAMPNILVRVFFMMYPKVSFVVKYFVTVI